MENASKALLIAGGILLAMLTVALIVLLSNNLKTLQNAQDEKNAQEQLVAFNRSYEAYNKKIMYGTDVISVVNKAIANNNLMQLRGEDQSDNKSIGYVNIIIKTNVKYATEVYWVNKTKSNPTQEKVTDITKLKLKDSSDNDITISKTIINTENFKMGTWMNNGDLMSNDNFREFFKGETKDYLEVYTSDDTTKEKAYYVYSALTTFKKSVFTCSNVEYNENGRIKEMTFTQVVEKGDQQTNN